MEILAHRGWWLDPAEKNSKAAFRRALDAGFGIETDVRDHDGALVISHDPPRGGDLQLLSDFLTDFKAAGEPGPLALNIKADGLQSAIRRECDAANVTNLFVFDMAVPDALGYFTHGFEVFTRHSEVEPQPAFLSKARGVWIDCFYGDWITADVVQEHRSADRKAALVSPELHRREPSGAWAAWRSLARDPGVMLCTDFPGDARDYFGGA